MEGELQPLDEGLSAPVKEEVYKIEPKKLNIGAAKSLKELSKDYGFFTPALLYQLVPLGTVDPLNNFLREYDKPITPFSIRFDKRIFQGMPLRSNDFWEYHCFALEREHWLPLMRWAKTLSFFDPRNNTYISVRPMTILIDDPLYLAQVSSSNAAVPKVEIGVFALDTNTGSVWLEEQVGGLPTVVSTSAVFEDTQLFSSALLTGDSNPFRKVEEAKLEPDCGLTPSQAWLIEKYGNRSPAAVAGIKQFSDLPQHEQQQIIELAKKYGELV